MNTKCNYTHTSNLQQLLVIWRRHRIQTEKHLLLATMNIKAACSSKTLVQSYTMSHPKTLVQTYTMSHPKNTVNLTFTTMGISNLI